MIENWVDFSLNVLGGAMALLCLYEGTRRLATYGVHRKAVLMGLLAVAACALYGTFAYWKYLDQKITLSAGQRKPAPVELPPDWGRGFSPDKKASLSLARARREYVESGTLGNYLDRNGETRSFAPAREDLMRRERLVAQYAQIEYSARASLAEALLWLISAVVAVVFGLVVSLEKVPTPGDPPPVAEPPPGVARPST